MKYKLSPAERAARIEQRIQARQAKATKSAVIRDWFDARRQAAEKRKKDAGETPRGPRGVDRVPDRYRVHPEPPTYLVEHHDLPRDVRRARGIRARSGNTPHVNPDRDIKALRSGRLRKELRP